VEVPGRNRDSDSDGVGDCGDGDGGGEIAQTLDPCAEIDID